tara:strand:+ start:43 stop:549 length:507 start_codon:yes stop_codon:yes gene_type:complete
MFKKILKFIKNIYQSYFELALAIVAIIIILVAITMDKLLFLQACPMCILTRYIFGLVALSALIGVLLKKSIISNLLIIVSSMIGLSVTSRQIYIQNIPVEDIATLTGCGMPFNTQIEYFGLIEAIKRTLAGGPSCAEDGWRFVFNFAEWGFLFFLVFIICAVFKLKNQ